MFKKKNRAGSLLICAAVFSTVMTVSWCASAQKLLSYSDAMDIALNNSPDILSTKLDLERSTETLKARQAQLKSNFSLTLNPFNISKEETFNRMFSTWSTNDTKSSDATFRISQPIASTDGTLSLINRFSWQDSYSDYNDITNKSFNNNLYLSFDQPLFTYNRTKMDLKELELDVESTALAYSIQQLSLEQQVASAFYQVYQNKMSLSVAEEELKNQEESYNIIKNKVDAGLAALEELYQAELNLASSRSSLQDRKVQLENNLDNLKLQIGLPIMDEVDIEADINYKIVNVDQEKAINNALISRNEIRQRDIDLENAMLQLVQTKALNEFQGNLNLSYGITGTDEDLPTIYDKPTQSQAVGISLEIPLWDWGESDARIRASEATIKRNKLSVEDQRNNIIINIREVCRSLNNQITQIEIAEQNVRNAQLTYEINLERYRNGDLTSMDLSLFQNQLSEVKMNLVQAQISYRLALLDLKIQSLWDFENNEPVVPVSVLEK